MYLWTLIGKIILAVAVSVLIVYVAIRYWRAREQRAEEERLEALRRQERVQLVKKRAARKRTMQESMALLKSAAERVAAEQTAAERAATERAAAERAAAEKAIADWVCEEELEERRVSQLVTAAEQAEAEEAESRQAAVERTIAEWAARMEEQMEKSDLPRNRPKTRRKSRKTDAVKEQVAMLARQLEQEMEELDFIVNEIQTKVDFLPIEVRDTIDKWKTGQIYRHHSFQDLKLKFRYQAYTIQDGWDIYHMYADWILGQRQKLVIFIRMLGTEPEPSENLVSLIARAERAEWEKYLKVDMDVIFMLREMREILVKTHTMQRRLRDLETACKRRAEQIIQPSWDPKGTL